jgi:hypothetical protein
VFYDAVRLKGPPREGAAPSAWEEEVNEGPPPFRAVAKKIELLPAEKKRIGEKDIRIEVISDHPNFTVAFEFCEEGRRPF